MRELGHPTVQDTDFHLVPQFLDPFPNSLLGLVSQVQALSCLISLEGTPTLERKSDRRVVT